MGDPLLVFAPTPSQCSEAVAALVALVAPLPLSLDFRPYFTIHDPDFPSLNALRDGEPVPPVLLGVTNLFFLKALKSLPNVLSVGRQPHGGQGVGGASRFQGGAGGMLHPNSQVRGRGRGWALLCVCSSHSARVRASVRACVCVSRFFLPCPDTLYVSLCVSLSCLPLPQVSSRPAPPRLPVHSSPSGFRRLAASSIMRYDSPLSLSPSLLSASTRSACKDDCFPYQLWLRYRFPHPVLFRLPTSSPLPLPLPSPQRLHRQHSQRGSHAQGGSPLPHVGAQGGPVD